MTHGAAAFAMMVFYGSLITSHVPSGWKSRRMKKLGVLMLVALSIQVITEYILYYLGNEFRREIISNIHALNGFIFPILLIIHIIKGMQYQNKRTRR